jgi:hypothetical protein
MHPTTGAGPRAVAALALFLCLLAIHPARAAELAPPLAPLADLVGRWQVLTAIPTEAGLREGAPGRAEVRLAVGGRALVEDVQLERAGAEDLRLRHTFTWDPYLERFRITVIDDASGHLDVYEGAFEEGRLLVDNLRAHTYSPTALGRELAFRMRWHELSPDGFRLDVYQSDDDGESWSLFAAHTYLRESEGESPAAGSAAAD